MRIFVIGQCTLHWGRMEFGNIGNYYIIEPFFRELHRVFPTASIRTTFQMSDGFCISERVECVPMNYYYNWEETDLDSAYKELSIATIYKETKTLIDNTPFIREVLASDLVVNFSGDLWGSNANFVGPNRFLVGLIKDRVVQLLGKPIVMLASSPGPFDKDSILPFAKLVFSNYTYISIREPVSKHILLDFGFNTDKVVEAACPAFLFEPASPNYIQKKLIGTPLESKTKPVVGFILCGWNLLKGPFNRTDWTDEEFEQYVEAISFIINKYKVKICLLSHSNGFELSPSFKPTRGRDFPLVKKLYDILHKTCVADDVYLFDGIYSPKETKAIIANFDMLISGRVHGAVAGLSQNVPTVIIDYGHSPKAHKLLGFAQIAGMERFLANPADSTQLKQIIETCWTNRKQIHNYLEQRNNNYIHYMVHKQFDEVKEIISHTPNKEK